MKRLLVLTFALSTMLFSCSKDKKIGTPAGKAHVDMYLTDGPGNYDAINLDIQGVEMTVAGTAVINFPITAGIYNLLDFKNGLDTFLGTADVPAGKIQQIRLVLGSNNTIVENGVSYPLTTPSGQTSGIKLNFHTTLAADSAYKIWIDFDAAKSIHQTGSGNYMLKPVIRAYSALTNGRIKGYVLPQAALATVYAISGIDTFSAIPDLSGFYKISGLNAGNYLVWFDADNLTVYQDTTIFNVPVVFGYETDLDTVILHP